MTCTEVKFFRTITDLQSLKLLYMVVLHFHETIFHYVIQGQKISKGI